MCNKVHCLLVLFLAIFFSSNDLAAQGNYSRRQSTTNRSSGYGTRSYEINTSRALEYIKAKAEAKHKENKAKAEAETKAKQVAEKVEDTKEEAGSTSRKVRDINNSAEKNNQQATKNNQDEKKVAKAADDITLVVDGEGPDKTEATKSALRNAIEQAYGTFVSANTTILNDDLVKDEIVTVSSGNIKSYKELSSSILPNGQTSVTLSAIVSIGKLISYAQSKGASAEFAGQTFMMNMKMRELNKKNEAVALDHLVEKLKRVSNTFYDYSIELGDPKETVFHSLYDNNNVAIYQEHGKDGEIIHGYIIEAKLLVTLNNNFRQWIVEFQNTLGAISLSEEDVHEYDANNTNVYKIEIQDFQKVFEKGSIILTKECDGNKYYLRNKTSDFINKVRSELTKGMRAEIIEKHSDGTDNTYHSLPSELLLERTSSIKSDRYIIESNRLYYNPFEPWFKGIGFSYSPRPNYLETNIGWFYYIPLLYKQDQLFSVSGFEIKSASNY